MYYLVVFQPGGAGKVTQASPGAGVGGGCARGSGRRRRAAGSARVFAHRVGILSDLLGAEEALGEDGNETDLSKETNYDCYDSQAATGPPRRCNGRKVSAHIAQTLNAAST